MGKGGGGGGSSATWFKKGGVSGTVTVPMKKNSELKQVVIQPVGNRWRDD